MRLFARGGGTARRKERVSVVEGFVGEREGLGWVWEVRCGGVFLMVVLGTCGWFLTVRWM